MKPSPFLQGVHHAYAQTDGSYALPNSREGDLLREAKREIESLRHVLKKTDDQAGLLMSVVEKLLQWPEAYPVKVFPEMSDDEWKRAAEVLSGAGLSLDRISASNMRHVALQVRKLVQEELGVEQGDEYGSH